LDLDLSRFLALGELRTRDQAGKTNSVGVLQVRVDRGHYHARFDRDQIDADQRDAHPRIDHDAFVEYAIEYVNKTGTAGYAFNSHLRVLLGILLLGAPRRGFPRRDVATIGRPGRRQVPALLRACSSYREIRVVLPPVQADLLGFVHRTNQQTDADGQQFHVRQRDTDVSGDDQTFVQDPIEDVDQIRCPSCSRYSVHAPSVVEV